MVCHNSSTGAWRLIHQGATPSGTGLNRACSAGETPRAWPALTVAAAPPAPSLAVDAAAARGGRSATAGHAPPTGAPPARPLLGALRWPTG